MSSEYVHSINRNKILQFPLKKLIPANISMNDGSSFVLYSDFLDIFQIVTILLSYCTILSLYHHHIVQKVGLTLRNSTISDFPVFCRGRQIRRGVTIWSSVGKKPKKKSMSQLGELELYGEGHAEQSDVQVHLLFHLNVFMV